MPAHRYAAALLLAAIAAPSAAAQDAPPAEEPNTVVIGERGSEQDPLAGRDKGLAIEAHSDPEVRQVEGILGVPAITVRVDPRVLGVAPGEPLPALRREGETIRKRDGRLLPSGKRGYAVIILDPDPQADPEAEPQQPLAMVFAPGQTLEAMERLMEDRGEDLRFTVTGVVHTYRGVNYLLPTSQPRPWLAESEPDGDIVDADTETQTDTEAAAGAETDTESPADPVEPEQPDPAAKGDKTPSSDEVLRQLLAERSDAPEPAAEPTDTDNTSEVYESPKQEQMLIDPLLLGLDPDQPMAELKKEGEMLVARTGRLIRSSDGAHALFVLDADSKGAPELPLILHGCKLLEMMEKTVMEQGENVPFVVTGQVFVYRGANYLLPTIVKREFDRGNLE